MQSLWLNNHIFPAWWLCLWRHLLYWCRSGISVLPFSVHISYIPAQINVHRPCTCTVDTVYVWETGYYCVGYIKAYLREVACWNVNVMTVEAGQGRSWRRGRPVRELKTVSASCMFAGLDPVQRFHPPRPTDKWVFASFFSDSTGDRFWNCSIQLLQTTQSKRSHNFF